MGAASYRMKRSRSSSLPPMARLPCGRKSGEEEEDSGTQEDQEEGRRGGLAERLVGRHFRSHEEPIDRHSHRCVRPCDRVEKIVRGELSQACRKAHSRSEHETASDQGQLDSEEPVGRMASEGLRGLDRVFRYTVQARDERADDEREGDENMSKEHQRPYGKPQGGAACPSKVESHGN